MTVKVAAFTSGVNVPSSRFRVRQLLPELEKQDVHVTEYPSRDMKYGSAFAPGMYYKLASILGGDPADWWLRRKKLKRWPDFFKSRFADVVWLERMLFSGKLTYETKFSKPLVFDFDDAIWLPGMEGHGVAEAVVKRSAMIFAGNQFLADWCSQYNANVKVVHTSVDTDRFTPQDKAERGNIRIGWIGSSSNFKYLQLIVNVLNSIVQQYDNVEIHVCADRAPEFGIRNLHFVRWSESVELEFIRGLDIGLMPLEDSKWARGKCSFKLLQYMACGIPALASPVGMNVQVLADWDSNFSAATSEEWASKLTELIRNSKLRESAGLAARIVIEKKYSSRVIGAQVAVHFNSLV